MKKVEGEDMKFDIDKLQAITLSDINKIKVRSIQLLEDPISSKEMLKENIYTYKNAFYYDIYIKKSYALEDKENILSKIKEMIQNKKESFLSIASYLIEEDIITCISNNHYLTRIELGSKENPYLLTKQDIKILKQNPNLKKIIVYQMEESIYDQAVECITSDITLQGYPLSKIKDLDTLYCKDPIKEEEITLFQKIPLSIQKIYFLSQDYSTILKCISHLNQNYLGQIIIDVKDKQSFYQAISKGPYQGNISLLIDGKIVSLKRYLETEKKLYTFLEPLTKENYSPLETYMYIYDCVKNIKPYRENENCYESARNLYEILWNEYIVCEGFSNLLVDLLKKAGIKAIPMTCAIENRKQEKEYHSRVLVHLEDQKYQISGYYISDPTWDSVNKNQYQYMLLTTKQVCDSTRKFYMDFTDIINTSSLEEMIIKLYKEPNYLKQLIKALEQIDPPYYQHLIAKYPSIGQVVYQLERQDIVGVESILVDIFTYTKTKSEEISLTQIEEAKRRVLPNTITEIKRK